MVDTDKKNMSYSKILRELRGVARSDKAEFYPQFFQAFPGGYGEGDQFLGVVVPEQRKLARKFRQLPRTEIRRLLSSKWHECRQTGLLILVDQFQRAQESKDREDAVQFYLDNLTGVNNWDLVDCSAHKILGQWLLEHPRRRKILTELARSKVMWEQRISIIATLPLIQSGQFDEILRLAKKFLKHKHDLMHKAVGWMLREMGKQQIEMLRGFLDEHAPNMPRTMLRYAIEKMTPSERQHWMHRE